MVPAAGDRPVGGDGAVGFGCSGSTDSSQPEPGSDRVPHLRGCEHLFCTTTTAFTQGLQWVDSLFYEGTGLRGESDLRRVHPITGAVLQRRPIAQKAVGDYFGEGITVLGDRIYQLTWTGRIGFMYDKNDV